MKRILIRTIDPLIVDYRPGVSNEHETLDYIPASRLRGACFEFRDKLGAALDIENLFGYGGPRWTHAWPSDAKGNHWHVMPKCFKPVKNGPIPLWLQRTVDCSRPGEVKQETNMSVGRHYGRRANRDSALYARKAISPGQYFVAYTNFAGSLPSTSFTLNMGTRHSANGLCEVTISDDPTVEFSSLDSATGDFSGLGNSAVIQLLSDAIVPAPGGGYLRGLGKNDFDRLAECSINVLSASSGAKTVSGWAGKWGLPRESAVAIEAGSVWLLQVDAKSIAALRAFTDKCLEKGLGVRAYEGYGTVAVNPAWLSLKDDSSLDCAITFADNGAHLTAPPGRNVHPPSWPESTGLNLELLNALIDSARCSATHTSNNLDQKELKHEAQKARQWMTWVARNGVTDHEKMPGRTNFEQVKKEQNIADKDLQAAQLFFLTVLESELIKLTDTPVTPVPVDGGEE
jgi:hypothetical protein